MCNIGKNELRMPSYCNRAELSVHFVIVRFSSGCADLPAGGMRTWIIPETSV
jgi:hypothetical protein